MVDWGISRNRYWGCPLPIWTCECGNFETIGSRAELKKRALENIDIDNLELHRPYVDDIHITCSKCGKKMSRVLDVMDVWFDSGSMPYAQFHYPFENKELFENQFPADFIAEGVDQTRGWFYVLLVLSTLISGKSSFKNVVVNDMMLDAQGKKMSKSVGNIIEPISIMTEYGADTVRWYMLYASPVWTPLKFDLEGLKEIYSKFISTLKNTYSFFQMYANADNIDPREYNVEYKDRDITDKWLLSKLNKTIRDVTNSYEKYDLNKVVHIITDFLNDDLSNWYIRSNRRRFWESELTLDKKAVYLTTYETLLTLVKLIAPIAPYISEEIYMNLTDGTSVHLADFPKYDESLINEEIEERMDLIRDVCSLGRFAREEAKIKVRQPLSELILNKHSKDIIGDLISIIKEELNIKNILFTDDMDKYMDYTIKPNFREVGKMFGSKIKEFQTVLSNLSNKQIEQIKEGNLTIEFLGEKLDITPNMVEINIKVKDGFCSSSNTNTFVILNTELTDELILEGLARELIRKVQSLRKEADLNIIDRIKIYYNGPKEIEVSINNYLDYIKNETLATQLIKNNDLKLDCELNYLMVGLSIEKI